MGQDCTALLVFGVILPKGRFEVDSSECDDEWLNIEVPKPNNSDYKSPEWDEWRNRCDAYEKSPRYVASELFGGDGNSRYCICASAITVLVEWQETAEITPEVFATATDAHRQAIREYMHKFDLPGKDKEPRWWLLSRYF